MDLKETLAISGHSGLFRFVSQGRNGIVVESFSDKKRSFVPATTKVSSLDDIAIYTNEKEVPLKEVLKSIFEKEKGGKAIDAKSASSDDLKKYMESILPEYDKERVYVSDIKKLFTWYNIMQEMDMLRFEETEKPAEAQPEESKNENIEATAEKSGKKAKPKTKPVKKDTDSTVKTKSSKSSEKERSPVKK
jgi:hypothetical protein